MTYVGRHTSGRALGDDDTTAPPLTLTGSASLPVGVDAGAYLIAQVNRFAPPLYPVASGKVGDGPATTAVLILARRALDATVAFHDTASEQMFAQVSGDLAHAADFVNANLALTASELAAYGDIKGLPSASIIESLSLTTKIAAAAGALLLAFLAFGGGHKKGRR